MANRNSEHLRYRYGICLNDNCQKCKTKEVQPIAARKDFVCEECGKPLRECPPPRTFMQKNGKMIGLLGGVVALGVIIGGIALFAGSSSETPNDNTEIIDTFTQDVVDTTQTTMVDTTTVTEPSVVDTAVAPEVKTPQAAPVDKPSQHKANKTAKIQVPFGTYVGPDNGLGGTITVTKAYSLDLRKGDGTNLELQPGDQIQQTKFQDGDLKQGVWVHSGSRQFFTR